MDKVRQKFGVGRASLGSLSESLTIFDSEPLKQIAAELSQQVPVPKSSPFDAVAQPIVAVDGSVIDTVVQGDHTRTVIAPLVHRRTRYIAARTVTRLTSSIVVNPCRIFTTPSSHAVDKSWSALHPAARTFSTVSTPESPTLGEKVLLALLEDHP